MPSFSVIVLLVIGISQTQASYPNGFVYSSDVNHILKCFERNAFGFLENENFLRPIRVPTLPFGVVDRQLDANGNMVDVWLPTDSMFPYPPSVFPQLGDPDESELLDFLKTVEQPDEPRFNEEITPLTRPSHPPPKACELLPSITGSGGQERVHISEDQDPIPFIRDRGGVTFDEVDKDETVPRDVIVEWRRSLSISVTEVFLDEGEIRERLADGGRAGGPIPGLYVNGIDQLCDIWIAKCPLTPIWAELPPNYFPRFFAQGTCSGKNCSFPRGLFCEEDFSYVASTAVLRWDCCFNPDEDPYKPQIWECGWRKVAIPILCDCFCGCSERSVMNSK